MGFDYLTYNVFGCFKNSVTKQKEQFVMERTYKRQRIGKYILKILQSLGGIASRDKIKECIAADEGIDISYNDVFEPVKSKKSGSAYIPFNYDFNFGIKELFICGLVDNYRRGEDISLTELGRAIEYNSFPTPEQMIVIDKYWDGKRQDRKEKKWSKTEFEPDDLEDSTAEEESSEDWKVAIIERIKQFSPKKFENFSRLLLSRMGIKFDPDKGIKMSGDHGIDGFGYFESDEFRTTRVAVQCKRFTESSVSEPEIDKFKGVMDGFNADYGIFVTTSYFTKNEREKAVQGTKTVTLIDGQKLVELIEKYRLHVTPLQTFILDEYYFEKD